MHHGPGQLSKYVVIRADSGGSESSERRSAVIYHDLYHAETQSVPEPLSLTATLMPVPLAPVQCYHSLLLVIEGISVSVIE
jgi:hypothetical protein